MHSSTHPCFSVNKQILVYKELVFSECNYSSLKSEFPSLYGQYKSDSPKEVNVTTFCRAEDKSDVELAGLQYQFTPPDHSKLTLFLVQRNGISQYVSTPVGNV